VARFLFEDFAHYFTSRKPRERFCVMVVPTPTIAPAVLDIEA
jgi:hypothetical protein